MAGDALRFSEPLFHWDPAAAEQGVSFDELHQRVVHRQRGGFSTANILAEGCTPDGLFIKFDHEGLRQVRFSPDGLYFVFLCDKRLMGCIETLHPTRDPIMFTFKWNKPDVEVLDFFWLPPPPQQADYADLVAVTTQGLEVFRLAFEQHVAKSLKNFPTPVRLCWVEPLSCMVLVCTGPRTLQPFDFRVKAPKLPKFELVLGSDQVIQSRDVAVMPIYDSVYCIHADCSTERVSLRNISNPMQGTPEYDIVIDVAMADKTPPGALRLSCVDNLLVVHCIGRTASMVFDIRHRERITVPCICGPCLVACSSRESGATPSWAHWDFLSGSTVLDHASGHVRRLSVDMGAVLQDFLSRWPGELASVMRLMLRRTSCRDHIVRTLRGALIAKPSFNEWAQAFAVLNQAYRQSIEALSQRSPAEPGRQTTVRLQDLEALISHQSILSENHMVSQVFHPHFMEVTSQSGEEDPAASASASDFGRGGADAREDRWRIPLPPVGEATAGGSTGSRPARSPYILSVVIFYLRSLLGMQILPHKILQCFVFDICMYFQQEHTLQQLLHYYVLPDSPELVQRLKEVATTRGCAWATQACLDMALRIPELSVVADMLLHTKQYLDIVPFLINQRDPRFKLRTLLAQVASDEASREEDPDLLEHVIAELRAWRAEAASGGGAAGADQASPPDLEGCEPWMPELRAATPAVAAQA